MTQILITGPYNNSPQQPPALLEAQDKYCSEKETALQYFYP